jgi:hypothetical protein
MKEIVWVFGRSAAGKKHFIEYIIEHPASSIVRKLGWNNKNVTFSPESVEHTIGDMREKRKIILERVSELIKSADVVLLKWQFTDSLDKLLQQMKVKLPSIRHRVIYLELDLAENASRLPAKIWWDRPGSEFEYTKGEYKPVLDSVKEIANDFEVTTIDSSASKNYEIVVFPDN